MRKFLGTLVLIVVVVAAIGVFSGWLTFSTDNGSGNSDFGVEVNRDKLADDTKQGAQELGDALKKAEEAVEGAVKGK
ncbi:MAG: hypothetical protein VYE64_09240 [Planctomycetota bacterium]|nr:hypothetical protein [Planctomycetota bacterium]